MPNSAHVSTDSKTLATTAFSAASLSKAAEQDADLIGMAWECYMKAIEFEVCLQKVAQLCDSADDQLTAANNILGTVS